MISAGVTRAAAVGGDGSGTLPAPVPTVVNLPAIEGTPMVGQPLNAIRGRWTNSPSGYAYQWTRCVLSGAECIAIPQATAQTYVPTVGDVGWSLAVSETATNSYGAGIPARSALVGPVLSGVPGNIAVPAIAGTAVEGQQLSLEPGLWSNSPEQFEDQWLRCDAGGGACRSLAGPVGLSYRLTVGDVGSTIRVQEITVNVVGSSAAAFSASTAQVLDAPVTVQAFPLVATARSTIAGPVASFVDPADPGAPARNYSAMIAWGDHSPTASGTVAGAKAGGYLVKASHAYARAAAYTITVRVRAAAGASAASTERVSVLAAAVCPKGPTAGAHNCLARISLPSGCVFPGDKLPVLIAPHFATEMATVRYVIDNQARAARGTGRTFAATLSTASLNSGKHRLTAYITYRSRHPPALWKRPFAVCPTALATP